MSNIFNDVLKPQFGDNSIEVLLNTIELRAYLITFIKNFVASEQAITIKENLKKPLMDFDTSKNEFAEFKTDIAFCDKIYSLQDLNELISGHNFDFSIEVEALDTDNVSQESWDTYLDNIVLYYTGDVENKVEKIFIPDILNLFRTWSDTTNTDQKAMLKAYNASNNIEYNTDTFWFEPIKHISAKYWKKLSFTTSINDYEIYSMTDDKFMKSLEEVCFSDGFFDEIIININYLYWGDDFKKLIDWTKNNLKSSLVTLNFKTILSEPSDRYFSEEEANFFNDTMRKNTMEEELEMYRTRLPILLNTFLTNPQSYGVKFEEGYFDQAIVKLFEEIYTMGDTNIDIFQNNILPMLKKVKDTFGLHGVIEIKNEDDILIFVLG